MILTFLAVPTLASDILRDPAGTAGLRLGTSISALGDQDGDGDGELLVGAPGADAAGTDAGRVYLWFGETAISLNANEIWDGTTGGEQFGHCVARIGDVNGDLVDDFAVGAPYANATSADGGRVYLFYGGTPLSAGADLVLESPSVGGQFGWSIAALGDFDGDGRDDFAVGAPMASATALEAGAVHVYYGDSGGPATTPDWTATSSLAGERLGWSLAGVGAFLGGSARCLAVGAPSNAPVAGQRQGAVYVYEGATSGPGPDTTSDLTLQTSSTVTSDNEFGYSVAAIGSFDGDSDPDLAVGAPFCDEGGIERGRVEIFFGGNDADDTTDRQCTGPAAGARLGWSVSGAGDITGSSLADVVMGAPYDNSPASEAGRAFIWAGGSGDVASAASLPQVTRDGLVDAPAGDHFGAWCAWAGDFDGDGLDDLAVGAPEGNVSSNAVAGWVRLVDSSGEATPVQLGGWTLRWTDDGAARGETTVTGVDAADVAQVRLVRHDDGGAVTLHAGALDGRHVSLAAGVLTVADPDAAWQSRGLPTYRLTLELAGGVAVETEISGPDGPRPDTAPRLLPAAPNPFNPATTLSWRATAGSPVTVDVLDLRGRRVSRIHAGAATGGWQQATWRGLDAFGRPASAGVYLVRLDAAEQTRTIRVTLMP
jgi:hypothetical protein